MLTFSGGQDDIINENTLNEHEGCRREGTRWFSCVKWRQLIFMSLAGAYNFNKGSIPNMYEWRVRHIPAVRRSWKVVLKWRRLQRLQYKAIGGQEDERHVWYFPMKVCDYMIWGYSSNKIWSCATMIGAYVHITSPPPYRNWKCRVVSYMHEPAWWCVLQRVGYSPTTW